MTKLNNDYISFIEVPDCDLYAVQLQDGGWSIADGMGSTLTPKDEMELSGWHLPVRFNSSELVINAIKTGPAVFFDIMAESAWARHAVECGGVFKTTYGI
jgi:hypothetical protein